MNRWWTDLAQERLWMEITDRADLGVDLNAPQLKGTAAKHADFWGYSLIKQVQPGDMVFHFSKPAEAILAWSIAAGSWWEDDVFWGAQGTSARQAGNVPVLRPGWRLGLEHFTVLANPVLLSSIRQREAKIFTIRDALESTHEKPTYFPFAPYSGQSLRPFQSYLVKFPRELARLFPALDQAIPTATQARSVSKPMPGSSLGMPYTPADENVLTSNPDPFSRDPALVERALQSHARIQNSLAEYVHSRGAPPRRPAPTEPDFDLAWEFKGVRYVAEVKSTTDRNEEKQLRLALGQVLRYADLMTAGQAPARAVVAVEREPTDQAWIRLCDALGVLIAWPGAWRRLPM
jgi:hypothetical protein